MVGYELDSEDRRAIEEGLRNKYKKVAVSPEGLFRYPTGRAGLEGLAYDPRMIDFLPPEVVSSYCGVGNPFALGPIHKGEAVLDVGCGGGVDTLIAGMIVGPKGKGVGTDVIPEMVDLARENLGKTPLENVTFQVASAEELPFSDGSFGVVLSNGAFNLVPDKVKGLAEVFRVLKPSGRLMMADQVLAGLLPEDKKRRIERWAR
jgi:arsenite methyltransferase